MHPISGSPLLRALVIVVPSVLVAIYLAAQIGNGRLATIQGLFVFNAETKQMETR
jgi:hypothetical protein